MTDQWKERLSEYLDDELTRAERLELEVHLAGCADCRITLQELEAVVARAGVLPDRDPTADLWPAVRDAIGSRKVVRLEERRKPARRFSFSISQIAAAAAALVLFSGGTVWFAASRATGPTTEAVTPPPSDLRTHTVSFDRKGRADSAITELERILAEESGRLDSSTVRILAQNLALIDRAINQAREALVSDPGNPYLNDHLARTMRKKIEVLRRAADLAQVAS
jgi:anti-sigma factor RsiW